MKFSLHTFKNTSRTVAVDSTGDEGDNELARPAIHRLNSYKGMYHGIFQLENLCSQLQNRTFIT